MFNHFNRDIEKMELIPSSGGVFEVSVNGEKIYSKDETGVFPDTEEIIKQIESL
ncbi:Rdx family protein [Neobacillus sp. PS3-40]|jgi:selT/selW/selH-like putative selenoprotein|nr:Rdx family protein [Neobacillus sp. PS3-40]WML44475.1 Rdx family protein [Neobacillus sp. PS3-40]